MRCRFMEVGADLYSQPYSQAFSQHCETTDTVYHAIGLFTPRNRFRACKLHVY